MNLTAAGIDLLIEAGKFLADPTNWCHGCIAKLDGREVDTPEEIAQAQQCCAEGALMKFGWKTPGFYNASYWLDWAAGFAMGDGSRGVHQINDECGHEEVMTMFRKAVKRAKECHKDLYGKAYAPGGQVEQQ